MQSLSHKKHEKFNIISDICDETFRFISSDKSDQFITKVINDICIEILIFVRSQGCVHGGGTPPLFKFWGGYYPPVLLQSKRH